MEKYVVIYDSKVCALGEERYVNNQTYYADSMEDVVVWLQEHPDTMVVCIAQLLK